jgi:myo-inositol-1(or 4)-monophosphatase
MLAVNVERIRMFGSADLDLAFVAEGRTDACNILANKPWDTAAGVLIPQEAGAQVVDTTNAPHSFSSTATIAAASSVSRPLMDEVKKLDLS